ncbi:MAG TPA: hypothetical protein VER33_07740 [Polyangiaceae bacterium]|nr:hypothetical protein [Polyangiaceae bacterium]
MARPGAKQHRDQVVRSVERFVEDFTAIIREHVEQNVRRSLAQRRLERGEPRRAKRAPEPARRRNGAPASKRAALNQRKGAGTPTQRRAAASQRKPEQLKLF